MLDPLGNAGPAQGRQSTETLVVGAVGATVGDFWAWAYSDILANTTRGVFAEYLVALALGEVGRCRLEWDAVDVHYRGLDIEIKSASYSQTWTQKQPSAIRFGIAKARSWHAESNVYDSDLKRSADCYVFALFSDLDNPRQNVADLSFWRFFVLPTARIDEKFGDQKTVALSRIEAMATSVEWRDLRRAIDDCVIGDDA